MCQQGRWSGSSESALCNSASGVLLSVMDITSKQAAICSRLSCRRTKGSRLRRPASATTMISVWLATASASTAFGACLISLRSCLKVELSDVTPALEVLCCSTSWAARVDGGRTLSPFCKGAGCTLAADARVIFHCGGDCEECVVTWIQGLAMMGRRPGALTTRSESCHKSTARDLLDAEHARLGKDDEKPCRKAIERRCINMEIVDSTSPSRALRRFMSVSIWHDRRPTSSGPHVLE